MDKAAKALSSIQEKGKLDSNVWVSTELYFTFQNSAVTYKTASSLYPGRQRHRKKKFSVVSSAEVFREFPR